MCIRDSHIQFNVIDRETLIQAQKHPDDYKDLIVRVAGYSAVSYTHLDVYKRQYVLCLKKVLHLNS